MKEMLHDDLFGGGWRNLDILERIKWLVDKVKGIL
jgi:hypothetical protein